MSETKMNEDYNPDIITLSDDDGNEFTFEVLDAIENDEARYLALLPVYEDPQKMLDDSGELVIVKVDEENGEEALVPAVCDRRNDGRLKAKDRHHQHGAVQEDV